MAYGQNAPGCDPVSIIITGHAHWTKYAVKKLHF